MNEMASAVYVTSLKDSYFQMTPKKIRPVSYCSPKPVYVEIQKGEKNISFKQPIMVRRRTIEGNCVSLEYEPLGVYAAGETLRDARESFWEDVAFMWRSYVKEDAEKLTEDAKNLKDKLMEYLTEA